MIPLSDFLPFDIIRISKTLDVTVMKRHYMCLTLLFLLSFCFACNENTNLSGQSDSQGLNLFLARNWMDIENSGGYLSNNIFVETIYSKDGQFLSLTSSGTSAHFSLIEEHDTIDTLGFYNEDGNWEDYFTKNDVYLKMTTIGNTRYIDYPAVNEEQMIIDFQKDVLKFPTEFNGKKVKYNGISRFVATLPISDLKDNEWLNYIQNPFLFLYSHIDSFNEFKFKAEFTFSPYGIYNPSYLLQIYLEWRFPLNADYNYDLYVYSITTNYYLSTVGSIDPTLNNPNDEDTIAVDPMYVTRFRTANENVIYNAQVVQNGYFGFYLNVGKYELKPMNEANRFLYEIFDTNLTPILIIDDVFEITNTGRYYIRVKDDSDTIYYGIFEVN